MKDVSPIFILSTGRAGTTAVHQLFKKSIEAFSYHSYQWQVNPLDMNHVLYRIIANKIEGPVLENLILEFVKIRTAELIHGFAKGKTPVFTGHWDTVFTPIWSVLFPNSRFIYLHRDDKSTFKSGYVKNMWTNNQLQPHCFDPSFPDGVFHASANPNLGVTEKMSWFLYITRIFSNKFSENISSQRYIKVKSEELFNAEKTTCEALLDFLKMPSLTIQLMTDHFATPINVKGDRIVYRHDFEQEFEKIQTYHQQLEACGKITPIS